MATEERQRLIESFIDTSLKMLHWLHPFVHALVAQPDREDILPDITDSGFRLFHFVEGTGAVLGFNHLVAPVAAMEYLLDRIRSGILPLTLPRIALLAEVCNYLERGLVLVREEQSDKSLADAASGLAAVIRQDVFQEQGAFLDDGSDSGIPEDAREVFFWETAKLIDVAEQECTLWDCILLDSDRVAGLSRVLNRLKQCFALYDFHDPERICLAMSSTINRFVQGEHFQHLYPEQVFLRCIDALRAALVAFPSNNNLVMPDVEQHLADLQGLMRRPIGALLVEAGLVDVTEVDRALAIQRSVPDGRLRFLGEVLVDMGKVTPEQVEGALREQHDQRTLISKVVRDPRGLTVPEAPLAVAVDGRRLERMYVLLERLLALQPQGEYLTHLNELWEVVLTCRLDMLASLASRLHRVVHDLAVESGKRVYFTIDGIGILQETDEAAVLVDSLCYLLRNSVEHGLETVEDRTHSGKRRTGRLHLLALRQDKEIWISVEDDGRGFDDERVKNLLAGRGLMTADGFGRLTNRERIALLFKEPPHPPVQGDGQGQGLVAVQKILQDIGGTMHVTTRSGKGTCVTLRVPRGGLEAPQRK
ncbi:MAG: ATP-binding protein [Desulfobulbus sp.]|nr:ATP-binding protein [Desulfobulbus sp.]